MPTPHELEQRFWKALRSDRVVMLGLDGVDDGHARPMSAQLEADHGPLWFFTTKENTLVRKLDQARRVVCTFAAKDHALFACVHGTLSQDADRALVERLWNPFVAAWYDGKDDPTLALLRLDPERAEVWENESSVFAGLKLLFGGDPKASYRDKVAKVDLSQ